MAKTAPTNKNILVIAGDPSGDLHAANLIKELLAKDPEISITSMGGVRMQEVSTHFIYNLVSVGAVGFAEPFKNFFLWFKLIKIVRRYLEEKRPACVIAVDFYGFNHQVLGLAAHRKIPAFYYISPQVWASRPGRAAKLAKLTREMFVIFPFEADIYKKVKGNATFVGHPLLDLMPEPGQKDFPPADGAWKIGILPGSRKTEISRHLPLFIKAFYRIKESHPKARAYLFAVPEFPDDRIVPELEAVEKYWSKDIEIVREKDYKIRAQMDFAFTCSGTATLENALLGVPMAVAYKMQKLTYAIAKRVAKVQYISLVNILLKKPAVKELIQEAATVDNLAQDAFAYINNPPRMQAARKELIGLRTMLGERGAAERAAARILAHLS
ncbi:MAG TPA: lipid-A-disaccharide synthase [Elusimicrobia bacterium]|nr:MAG: lipid-A-disaccharide synthase [Elusimicrobia bacterium GWA2_64_40]OGR67915.1 MAG: lipid-A-disaccharide synthase [Elusimicrobia bacterium GWB2_63_16]HAU90656.1 lipid-A-disaccharide synthase [Elusimicrobiota bacterium]